MEAPVSQWLAYRAAIEWSQRHPLRLAEIPVEHAVSTPLPTLAWGAPAYVQFAAPARRAPDRPTLQGAPDRWWLFDARGGRLLAYVLAAALPNAKGYALVGLPQTDCEVTSPAASVAGLRDGMKAFAAAMEDAAPRFLAAQVPVDAARTRQLFEAVTPAALLAAYRAAAPDFFAWLGA